MTKTQDGGETLPPGTTWHDVRIREQAAFDEHLVTLSLYERQNAIRARSIRERDKLPETEGREWVAWDEVEEDAEPAAIETPSVIAPAPVEELVESEIETVEEPPVVAPAPVQDVKPRPSEREQLQALLAKKKADLARDAEALARDSILDPPAEPSDEPPDVAEEPSDEDAPPDEDDEPDDEPPAEPVSTSETKPVKTERPRTVITYSDPQRLRAMATQDLADEREYLRTELEEISQNIEAESAAFCTAFYGPWAEALDEEIGKRTRKLLWPAGGVDRTFTPEMIAAVKDRTDTVSLIEGYGIEMHKRGNTWKGLCPFHAEKTPSFTVFDDGGWHCFSCQESGDAIAFVMRQDTRSFPEAVRELARRAGVVLPEPKRKRASEITTTAKAVSPQGRRRETDIGNAERLIDRFGHEVRYCHPFKSWLIWDGRRWVTDQTGEITRRAVETIRGIYHEAGEGEDADTRKRLAKFATQTEKVARVRAMIDLAASAKDVVVVPSDLDCDLWVLNVLNGTLDLRTGTLKPHDPRDLITKLAPVEYDPDARHPLWDRFLAETTSADPEFAAFLARAAGYTLTGVVQQVVVLFAHGETNTGKSSFLGALKATMGDYAVTADFDTFLKQSRGSSSSAKGDVARLEGARLVTSIETGADKSFAEGLLKWLTGGDTVVARLLYKKEREFTPGFKIWLAANVEIAVPTGDTAVWRRLKKLPFVARVEDARIDETIRDTLKDPAEVGPAILAWAVRGCLDWQARGLQSPQWVEQVTREYRDRQDVLGEFLTQECRLDPAPFTPACDLLKAYERWCEEEGVKPVGRKLYGQSLRGHGCEPDREYASGRTVRGWRGVGLLIRPETDDQGTGDPEEDELRRLL